MNLENKTIVITGISGGIGKILYKKLVDQNVNLILIDQAGTLMGLNGFCVDSDFSDMKDIFLAGSAISKIFKKVDVLINLAGIGIYKSIDKLSIKEFEDSININLIAPFVLTKFLYPALLKSNNGLVINVGSGMGIIPQAERSAYCTSKFGLRGLSLSLNKELKGKIDISLLTLGSVMTGFGTGGIKKRKELQKEGKNYLSPEEVVNKILSIIESKNRKAEYIMYPKGYK